MKKTTTITREEVQDIITNVNYPGFNRDIVSFGMVKDNSIQDEQINISLQINSDNENTLNQLQTDNNKFNYHDVEVILGSIKRSKI